MSTPEEDQKREKYQRLHNDYCLAQKALQFGKSDKLAEEQLALTKKSRRKQLAPEIERRLNVLVACAANWEINKGRIWLPGRGFDAFPACLINSQRTQSSRKLEDQQKINLVKRQKTLRTEQSPSQEGEG
ncbi:2661ec8b-68b7-4727-9144-0d85aaac00a5 [Sclerotinia trifoliorum]|uniref:2661ec8b-68b7-4727-9144-0d85aaac00a5 n=1 Tax=Sclerotinia trifoliorum TaxID=28548 RepID=A0A8H2VZJ1_9HELO|nr:2661ec8b-68b7-4727-9144-0d85aaac00a5 [Sclerotinia trifoliorum]